MSPTSRFSQEAGAPLSIQWLISFGDLLTLLLCFFVALLATCPMSVPGSSGDHELKGAAKASDPILAGSVQAVAGGGTRIAKLPVEVGEESVVIRESQLGENSKLRSEDLDAIRKLLSFKGFALDKLQIESCSPTPVPKAEEAAWFSSINRSLQLRSQLIDAGFAAEQVAVRAVGPWCQAIVDGGTESSDVAAVIRIRTRRAPQVENG